jgi:hypothetical protein
VVVVRNQSEFVGLVSGWGIPTRQAENGMGDRSQACHVLGCPGAVAPIDCADDAPFPFEEYDDDPLHDLAT